MVKSIPLLALSALLFLSACATDDDANPNVDERDKYLGKWSCQETIGPNTITFEIYITSYGAADSIRISNFSGYGNTSVALGLVSGNSLVIPYQQVSITNIPVQGSGTYVNQGANDKINMNYTTDGQSATAVCTR